MILTIPMQAALPLSAALVVILGRTKEPYATAIVSVTLIVVFVMLELVLRLLPLDKRPQYYRPHELLVQSGKGGAVTNYLPNKRIENFHMPFGDLGALSFIETTMEPRTVNFLTDSLGFRNRTDYAGEEFVVFGDSFVVGLGNTQRDILSEILTRSYGLATYNAGFPGSIDDYVDRVTFMRDLHGHAFKAIFVVFEGNDFPCEEEEQLAHKARRASRKYYYVPGEIRDLQAYRFFYGLTRRLYHAFEPPGQANDHPIVHLARIGNQTVGFLRHQLQVVKRTEPCDWRHYRALLESVAEQIQLVVFVPTKYRVYASLFNGGRGGPLPNVQGDFVEAVSRDRALPYLDLTEDLIAASREHLTRGEYTFWRDDSHWNGNGIRAAAAAIARRLRTDGLAPRQAGGQVS